MRRKLPLQLSESAKAGLAPILVAMRILAMRILQFGISQERNSELHTIVLVVQGMALESALKRARVTERTSQ